MSLSNVGWTTLACVLLSASGWAREIPLSDEPTRQRSWLDGGGLGWNVGENLPLTEPKQPLDSARCKAEIRSADSEEERRVEGAGWMLTEPVQRVGQTVLVTGTDLFDGLCHAAAVQVFAFSGGQFVGTLAPQPMPALADGELLAARVNDDGAITAEFARYRATDPLGSPTRISSVSYRIERMGEARVLLPEHISTEVLPSE